MEAQKGPQERIHGSVFGARRPVREPALVYELPLEVKKKDSKSFPGPQKNATTTHRSLSLAADVLAISAPQFLTETHRLRQSLLSSRDPGNCSFGRAPTTHCINRGDSGICDCITAGCGQSSHLFFFLKSSLSGMSQPIREQGLAQSSP